MVLAKINLRDRSRQSELRRRMIRQTEDFLNRRLRARRDPIKRRVARPEERRAWQVV